jgi:hypothetical protein
MKTKEGEHRCQVSGAGRQGKSPETTVPKSEVRTVSRIRRGDTGSSLLSPDFCLLHFKNEGASSDMYENKGCQKLS